MIAIWMLRMLVAAVLIAVAAHAAEEVARGFGWPRRWIWTGAFVLVASVPWLGGLLPAPSLTGVLLDRLVSMVTATQAAAAGAAGSVTASGSDFQRLLFDGALLGGWTLASLALAFVFGHALWRVRTVRRSGDAAAAIDGVDVIHSETVGPATVGIVRPAIVLPRWVDRLPEAERAVIVSHEREHARAHDPLLLAASALAVVAAPWCLPLWWMHRRLRDAVETDCDVRVIARGVDILLYGRALLQAAGRPRPAAIAFAAPLLGGIDISRLERRILTMTDERPKHPWLRAVPLIGIGATATVLACASAGQKAAPEFDRPTADRQATDEPVFYIDGERVDFSTIRQLDRAMIESINVIKGPAAVALYGADGTFGAVLVTLKNR